MVELSKIMLHDRTMSWFTSTYVYDEPSLSNVHDVEGLLAIPHGNVGWRFCRSDVRIRESLE